MASDMKNNHICLQQTSQLFSHTAVGSYNALWPPVKHCNSLSLPALAVLNMQLVYFTSLLAKLPIVIRMFEKKTKQEKVKAQTDR